MKKRIVKKSEDRKKEILAAAKELFDAQGYDKTSIENILQKLSISKGAFYHHFKGKKELLLTLVDEIGVSMKTAFSQVAGMDNLSAVEKLELLLCGKDKKERVENEVMDTIHQPQNSELQERLNIYAIENIAPILAKIIEQGNDEGVFNADTPLESMQLLLASSLFVFDSGLFFWPEIKRRSLLKAQQTLFELAIGATRGSLAFILPEK